MARRTKEESSRTREAILSAAREMFLRYGVARTTMEQIAEAAGVTRGAVYFHFPNKTAVFYAVRDQVALPLMDRMHDELLQRGRAAPLERIGLYLHGLLDALTQCSQVRSTFEILSFKCEYVDEFQRELSAACASHSEILDALARAYGEAAKAGGLRAGLTPELAAKGTLAFVTGLIRLLLMDGEGVLVRPDLHALLDAHLDGQRSSAGARAPLARLRTRH